MYTRILVPLDGSETAECVLPYVKWFTKVSDLDELVFLRVVEPLEVGGVIIAEERSRIEKNAMKIARTYVKKIASEYQSDDYRTRVIAIGGKPAKVISDFAETKNVDLIIMATRGFSGVQRVLRGSVADEVLHHAKVPVLMVTPKNRPPDK